jgi:NTP pyrophosphatase (non-canonical NTP hydrolase)
MASQLEYERAMKVRAKQQNKAPSSITPYAASVYRRAREKWGIDSQVDMLVEECAELIAATNRVKRSRTDLTPWFEEIADAEIMLEQMREIYGHEQIDAIKVQKLRRLAERTGCTG